MGSVFCSCVWFFEAIFAGKGKEAKGKEMAQEEGRTSTISGCLDGCAGWWAVHVGLLHEGEGIEEDSVSSGDGFEMQDCRLPGGRVQTGGAPPIPHLASSCRRSTALMKMMYVYFPGTNANFFKTRHEPLGVSTYFGQPYTPGLHSSRAFILSTQHTISPSFDIRM